jgi:hypothetical protein
VQEVTAHDARPIAARHSQGSPQMATSLGDNRCTMHRARPFDDQAHRRELRRTTTLDLPLPASA